ncbi:MAG: alginate O-acetyltransferase complex protein AlgI, partial [Verrucomicrobiota bacterium]
MVFSSHIFVYYFLPLVLLGYYALARAPQRWRNFWLILTGYTFYGWAEPRFMPLMFATTFVDWLVSLIIAHDTWQFWRVLHKPVQQLPRSTPRTRTQRHAILISVLLNLATLGFFKYFNFGIE